jgi:hypothetical protein
MGIEIDRVSQTIAQKTTNCEPNPPFSFESSMSGGDTNHLMA